MTFALGLDARTPPTVLESIDRLEKALAQDQDREPTLSAIDPLLEERLSQAKKLASVGVAGMDYPPATVYFCSDRESMSCPDVYADDTIHLYEGDFAPQFAAPEAAVRVRLSSDLGKPGSAFLGNTGELHGRGYQALRPLLIDSSGQLSLAEGRGRGKQVLLVFAETPDHRRRFKFVWLVEGSTVAPRSSVSPVDRDNARR